MNAIIAVILATMFMLSWSDRGGLWRYLAVVALGVIAAVLRLIETGYLL